MAEWQDDVGRSLAAHRRKSAKHEALVAREIVLEEDTRILTRSASKAECIQRYSRLSGKSAKRLPGASQRQIADESGSDVTTVLPARHRRCQA
jgi:hypothetical protein